MKKQTSKLKLCVLLIMLVLFAATCSDSVTPPTHEPDSTSHEIIWEIDTLAGDINAVWGSTPESVWAAGLIVHGSSGTNLVHYDGERWEEYDHFFSAELFGIFGSNENDIWAVGSNLVYKIHDAVIVHFDGVDWKTEHIADGTPGLIEVWAAGPSDVFAVGLEGTILHYDGENWTQMESGTIRHLTDVWGFGPNDVYASGGLSSNASETEYRTTLLHYDGNKWDFVLNRTEDNYVYSIWGESSNNLYFSSTFGSFKGNKKDGWIKLHIPDDNTAIRKLRGSSEYNIFLSGPFGLLLHYNGITWHRYEEIFSKTFPYGPILNNIMVFENFVFIFGKEEQNGQAIVYKGIIKN